MLKNVHRILKAYALKYLQILLLQFEICYPSRFAEEDAFLSCSMVNFGHIDYPMVILKQQNYFAQFIQYI